MRKLIKVKKILFFLNISFVLGCSSIENQKTYLDGRIIKTSTNIISVLKDEKLIKSEKIFDDGYFKFELDSITNGLYNFQLNPEFQYIILNNGDSISLRLNTLDFDESLVFIGKGSSINNFLIDIFLKKEMEQKFLNKQMMMEYNYFKSITDSLIKENEQMLSDFKKNKKISKTENIILKYALFMPIYSQMERYYSINSANFKSSEKNSFFEFRKNINFNIEQLSHFKPYLDYLIVRSENQDDFHVNDFENIDLNYSISRLKFINSKVQNKKIKAKVLRHIAYEYLLKEEILIDIDNFLFEFKRISENLQINDEIQELYKNIVQLQIGKKIPQFELFNTKGELTKSNKINSNKKLIYTFWSVKQDSHKNSLFNRIFKIIEQNNQDYTFVCININEDESDWLESIKKIPSSKSINHFKSKYFDDMSKKMILDNLNKIVITNKNGIILDISDIAKLEMNNY